MRSVLCIFGSMPCSYGWMVLVGLRVNAAGAGVCYVNTKSTLLRFFLIRYLYLSKNYIFCTSAAGHAMHYRLIWVASMHPPVISSLHGYSCWGSTYCKIDEINFRVCTWNKENTYQIHWYGHVSMDKRS